MGFWRLLQQLSSLNLVSHLQPIYGAAKEKTSALKLEQRGVDLTLLSDGQEPTDRLNSKSKEFFRHSSHPFLWLKTRTRRCEKNGVNIYVENCFSLASMLLCLMHILVRAEPMSRVPPEKEGKRKHWFKPRWKSTLFIQRKRKIICTTLKIMLIWKAWKRRVSELNSSWKWGLHLLKSSYFII